MKLGFLALQAPHLSPGQRYRFEAFQPAFEQAQIEVEYHWLLDQHDLKSFYGNGSLATKGGLALKGLWRRAKSLLGARRWDVVFVQREAFFLLGAWSETIASTFAPLVFDLDDAIWIKSMSDANRRLSFLKSVSKMRHIASRAQTVIAGNEYLATWARQHNRNVQVIPTCIETDRYRPDPVKRNSDVVTIGWSGSPTTLEHLQPILGVLARLKERYGAKVRFRVMGAPHFVDEKIGIQGEAWNPEAELVLLQSLDIGLMPLPDNEWTRGKCGLKGLASMAVGAATVMSPVGVNIDIVKSGVNGLLCATEAQWFESLSSLIENRSLREELGAQGRETVVQHYSVNGWKQPMIDVLEAAARAKKR